MVEYLLENGADVNARDKGGLIPLHNASSYGVRTYNTGPGQSGVLSILATTYVLRTQHVDVALLLIKYNSLVNMCDRWNFTPLHEAAQKGRTQLCSLLVCPLACLYVLWFIVCLFVFAVDQSRSRCDPAEPGRPYSPRPCLCMLPLPFLTHTLITSTITFQLTYQTPMYIHTQAPKCQKSSLCTKLNASLVPLAIHDSID